MARNPVTKDKWPKAHVSEINSLLGGGGIQGYIVARHFSREITSMDHMERPLREYLEKHHAHMLVPPEDWDVFPLKSSQEGFVEKVPPEV